MLTQHFSSKGLKALYKEINIIIPDGTTQTEGLLPFSGSGSGSSWTPDIAVGHKLLNQVLS